VILATVEPEADQDGAGAVPVLEKAGDKRNGKNKPS
jgi:hypothetical protein